MSQAGTGSDDLSVPRPWSVPALAPFAELRRAADVAWDVVVVGCGNAALVAALAASRSARRVLVLERAPRHLRGGNTRHTRNIRCAHDEGDDFTPGRYSVEELISDLEGVGRGPLNPALARLAALESQTIPAWMEQHGVRWQHSLAGTLSLSRTNRFFLGGGTALVNHYARVAEAKPDSTDRRSMGGLMGQGGGLSASGRRAGSGGRVRHLLVDSFARCRGVRRACSPDPRGARSVGQEVRLRGHGRRRRQ
jgi:succinate dehydrogenase/fumarate reductase flavoprotein subunit